MRSARRGHYSANRAAIQETAAQLTAIVPALDSAISSLRDNQKRRLADAGNLARQQVLLDGRLKHVESSFMIRLMTELEHIGAECSVSYH